MTYKRRDYSVSVEQVVGFGKNPGLWIQCGNISVKVASFGNAEKAELFMEYLDWLLTNEKEPPMLPISEKSREGDDEHGKT